MDIALLNDIFNVKLFQTYGYYKYSLSYFDLRMFKKKFTYFKR